MSAVVAVSAAPIRFQVGERTLWTVRRRLRRVALDLDALLAGTLPRLPALGDADGYDLRSWPEAAVEALIGERPELLALVRQRYQRRYAPLDDADAFWRGFSGKTRSTLRRKRARWAEAAGGLDVREYHRPDQAEAFQTLAGDLSRLTYQDRLLDAGLPTGPAALADLRARAERGDVRAYILFHHGRPASYLHLPIDRGRVVYAHLGYDPALADLSPGTVLHCEILDRLFADPAARLLDFTEGDGAHKRLFAREAIACVDMLLLRRTLRNRALIAGLSAFDRAVAEAAGLVERWGVKPWLRRLLRA